MTPSARDDLPLLQIVIASTREGRVGAPVARWFERLADESGLFRIQLIDLKELGLPFLDEPHHPRLEKYVGEHTKAWSATISAGDAFVFVVPEYNFSFNAPIKNAFDYLFSEWKYKPIGFVAYGGVSAGTRAVQALKQVVSAPPMLPVGVSVTIPFIGQSIVDGVFHAPEISRTAANEMVDELSRWIEPSRLLRANPSRAAQ